MMEKSHKEALYQQLLKQVKSVIDNNNQFISNLANCTALIRDYFDHHWIGFYLVDIAQNELYLGPFQGPLACTKIAYGRGVCGTAWQESRTIIVDDVHQFSGHIACSAFSNSEIVVPLIINNKVIAVLDIDSIELAQFNDIDQKYLEEICQVITDAKTGAKV